MARIGETLETAIWMDGRETPEQVEECKRDIEEAFDYLAMGFVRAPATFTEMLPGQDRVPEVPKHVDGPKIRLLHAETEILASKPTVQVNSFLGDLEKKDLERLRAILRRIGRQYGVVYLTDEQCDRKIEEIGPEAAVDAVRKAVDGGYIH